MWSDFLSTLKGMDLQQINEILSNIDFLTLLKNPWVIAFLLVSCIVFIIRGMERVMVTFLSVPAALVLFQKTAQGDAALDLDADKMLLFIGGFVVIAGVNIYFWVVRSGK